MFGVPLACALFAIACLAHLGFCHAVSVRSRERVLIAFMVAAGVVYVALYALGPQVSALSSGASRGAEDLVAGLCALGFLVLGYVEFWSLIERSFSLRILVDAAARGAQGVSRADLARAYGGGRGLDWMMAKRIEGLIASGMVEPDGSSYRLSRKGQLVARAFRELRRLLGPGDPRALG